MGCPLDGGSFKDGTLTCHWHHGRFELASGCTFDLWADDVPTCPVEIRAGGEIWVKPVFGYANPSGHWRQRLKDGLGHNLSLVIAKAVHGQLAAGLLPVDVVRQGALFGTRNRDGWDTGLTILTALGQLLPFLSEEETHVALFHGVRRVGSEFGASGRPRSRLLSSRPKTIRSFGGIPSLCRRAFGAMIRPKSSMPSQGQRARGPLPPISVEHSLMRRRSGWPVSAQPTSIQTGR